VSAYEIMYVLRTSVRAMFPAAKSEQSTSNRRKPTALVLREAGPGGSNPLSPTIEFRECPGDIR
jgi:hypothetical protein